jgi:hypothetical protein
LTAFVALYKGRTITEAELVAVSAEPCLVHRFFTELVGKQEPEQDPEIAEHAAPVLEVVGED